MGVLSCAGTAIFVIAVGVGAFLAVLPPRQSIPAHLKGHPVVDVGEGFLPPATVDGLLAMTRRIGRISTASREYDVYKARNDNIGESVPIIPAEDGAEGGKSKPSCPKPFLMPSGDMTRCIFPGRIDVGKHFIQSGGIEAVKEDFATLAARAQPFQAILFNWTEHPVAAQLMKDEKFLGLAKAVCPKDKPFLDPFQFNLVVQVPGQTVAAHIDAPVFFKGTRLTLPQWFMAAMVFSGLFQEEFIDQVQLVGYYHKWAADPVRRGGRFFFWNDDDAKGALASDPVSGSANSVDGSKMVHAAGVYMPHRKPPALDKDRRNELVYNGHDERTDRHHWGIEVDGVPTYDYDEDDIRFSAVYRARCFRDESERARFHRESKDAAWTVDEVLSVFEEDMKAKGTWPFDATETAASRASPKDRYELGLAILAAYVRYPYSPDAVIPVNYCALGRLYPWLAPALKLVCA